MSLLCSDWSDGPVCYDWSTAYSASETIGPLPQFCILNARWKYKHLLFIILTGCYSVEPLVQINWVLNHLSRAGVLCIPLNSLRLEKQSSDVFEGGSSCLRPANVEHRRELCKCVAPWYVAITEVGFELITTRLGCIESILYFGRYKCIYHALSDLQLCRSFTFTYSYITHCMKGNIGNGIIGAL